ncbi:dipeptidase [Wenxinia marina]|uniref:Zn-dependent dipeptidase, microsomal dipeptidase-like protein n=1 Tax=Wenxinia marina DSM 24838 TaxID=1123501 RepID=A0A0D0NNI1_9RHOB|nr:membrane dipeptidase [Wenxinia marina]KIQ69805.1 Zn-dependent dipeptidase, microsomal dipeptidase-like protein [Wenxinia marina DSM 24838]GGL61365.1 peptidase M19 [Wenxinia marina]
MIFDGHNDALGRLWAGSADPVADFARPVGMVNVPDAAAGGLRGGFFALFSTADRSPFDPAAFDVTKYAGRLPAPLDEAVALQTAIAQAGIARRLEAAGHLAICRDGAALNAALEGGPLACILHLEGADAIGPDLLALDAFYAMGLRSLGIVWSRPTIFGHGVPFGWNADGDTGPGLTEDGRRLIARCAELGIVVDTSHLTMKGFWDVGEAGLPLVATHSNAVAVAPSTRNLTDAQLRAVGETGGMVGLNFGTIFLDEAGWTTRRSTIDACLRQLDHMISVAGEDHVGLGSDFDGAPMPDGLSGAADLPALVAAMRAHGFGDALTAKLCAGNWIAFLHRHFERTPR